MSNTIENPRSTVIIENDGLFSIYCFDDENDTFKVKQATSKESANRIASVFVSQN